MKAVNVLKELVKFTIPAGYEELLYLTVQNLCNKKLNIDEYGNMYIKIGESDILFTAHLDTYSDRVERVNSYIENGFLQTDGDTILGGDNKTGCAILLNMINNNINGTYYFFVREEVGREGSMWLNNRIDKDEYKLVVAFDRRETNRLVTHQRALKMCNDNLTNLLLNELSSEEYKFYEDHFGFSCDTFSFIDKINNCINISNGTYDEHKSSEKVDLKFFEYLYNKVLEIDWDGISKLSNVKVREDLDFSKHVGSKKMLETINYLLSKGYRPNKIPKFKKIFGLYTLDLYIKDDYPKIYDWFNVSILKNGDIKYRTKEFTKEEFYEYIKIYKEVVSIEFEYLDSAYRIVSINYDKKKATTKIIILKDDYEMDEYTTRELKSATYGVKMILNNMLRPYNIVDGIINKELSVSE